MDFPSAREEIEKEMVISILQYLKDGVFPKDKSKSYMNAYFAVNTCADEGDQQSSQLYQYHNNIIDSYINDCYDQFEMDNNNDFIDSFIHYTDHINILIYWMNIIFCYLDRFYTIAIIDSSLAKSALNLYKVNFFDHFKVKIFIKVNKLIEEDRKGNKEYRQKIKAVMNIFKCLDYEFPEIKRENNKIFWIKKKDNVSIGTAIQDSWFNNYFEEDTKKFSKEKGNKDIRAMSSPEYIKSQLEYLDEESERKKEFINSKFHEKINNINYECLIGAHSKEIIEKETGLQKMLNMKEYSHLANLYKLFKLYPTSLEEIKEKLKNYIKERGNSISVDKELTRDPLKFIPRLISLKKEIDELVEKCFENYEEFQDAKNDAFSFFMEREIYSKQLANYADYCLRSFFRGKSEQEIDNILNDIIQLFKCLRSLIHFQNHYEVMMSDRLIKNQSLSEINEKNFINKLSREKGPSFVSKMNEMLNDLNKNKNNREKYKSSENKGAPNGIILDVKVLSQSAWEINKKNFEKFKLPNFLSSCLEDYEKFYLKIHPTHKLMWCLGLSNIDIEYLYLKQKLKFISISTLPQLLCLLHLEKKEKLTLGTLANLCECSKDIILKDIQGLFFNKNFKANEGIIKCTSNSKLEELKETDEIFINKDFSCSKLRISTKPLVKKKTESEIKTEEDIEAKIIKRKQENIIQSTITRIMKSRIGQKTTHVYLIEITAQQIFLFKAQPKQIKEMIEKLIEKDIIKRKKDCYEYIA